MVNIKRINELTAISRERELTDEEKKEREQLRREYIDSFKVSLVSQLDSIKVKDEQGNVTSYQDYVRNKKEQPSDK